MLQIKNSYFIVRTLLFISIFSLTVISLYSKGLEVDKDAPRNFSLKQLEEKYEECKQLCKAKIKRYADNHQKNIINKNWNKIDYEEFEKTIIKPTLAEFNSLVGKDYSSDEKFCFKLSFFELHSNPDKWSNQVNNRVTTWLRNIKEKYKGLILDIYASRNYTNTALTPEQKYKLSLKKIKIERPNEEENIKEICEDIRKYIANFYKEKKYSTPYDDKQIFSTESEFYLYHPGVLKKATDKCIYEVGKHNDKIYVKCKIHGTEEY